MEDGGIQIRIGPVGFLEGRKPEMDEHAEAQVHELLLQLVQALALGAKCQGKGDG